MALSMKQLNQALSDEEIATWDGDEEELASVLEKVNSFTVDLVGQAQGKKAGETLDFGDVVQNALGSKWVSKNPRKYAAIGAYLDVFGTPVAALSGLGGMAARGYGFGKKAVTRTGQKLSEFFANRAREVKAPPGNWSNREYNALAKSLKGEFPINSTPLTRTSKLYRDANITGALKPSSLSPRGTLGVDTSTGVMTTAQANTVIARAAKKLYGSSSTENISKLKNAWAANKEKGELSITDFAQQAGKAAGVDKGLAKVLAKRKTKTHGSKPPEDISRMQAALREASTEIIPTTISPMGRMAAGAGIAGAAVADKAFGAEVDTFKELSEIERLKKEYPELSSELGRFGVSSSEYTPTDLSSTGDYFEPAAGSAAAAAAGSAAAAGFEPTDWSTKSFAETFRKDYHRLPKDVLESAWRESLGKQKMQWHPFPEDHRALAFAVGKRPDLYHHLSGSMTQDPYGRDYVDGPRSFITEVFAPGRDTTIDGSGTSEYKASPHFGGTAALPSEIAAEIAAEQERFEKDRLAEIERANRPKAFDWDTWLEEQQAADKAELEAARAASAVVYDVTKASHPGAEPLYEDTLSQEDLAAIMEGGEFSESDRKERPGDIGKFLKDAKSEAEVRKAWEDWADYGTPTDGSSDTIVVDPTTGVDVLYDGSTPVLDMIGPGASGDKMSFSTGVAEAEFRPSGLARFGLGAGSLGAGLMATSTPISPSSYIEGEIGSPRIPAAHHGPVWPEFIPSSPFGAWKETYIPTAEELELMSSGGFKMPGFDPFGTPLGPDPFGTPLAPEPSPLMMP